MTDATAAPSDPDPAPPSVGEAAPARARPRHYMLLLSFIVLVIGPTALAGWYMWTRAADRYVSTAGFSVRTEEVGSAIELLGGVAQLSGSSSSDTDILYDYIQSQELVRQIDDELDLRAIWTRVPPEVDPLFAYHAPGTIEDLTDYWNRMVRVYNDGTTGLLELRVQSFRPEDSQAIAQMVYDKSAETINQLSAIARADATDYAREELDSAVERLKSAREAITLFRNRTQIVDPAASIQSQMGILSSLQSQLAQTLVDLDLLRDTAADSDPRIAQTENRIAAIEARIADERRKLGFGTGENATDDGTAFADLVGEYERLIVDLQFAEQSYTAALATYDSAVAEARRQSRYLAAHVRPTLAEASTVPRRLELTLLTALFAFLAWAILSLAAYAIRDRR